jgi:hypothetical protein
MAIVFKGNMKLKRISQIPFTRKRQRQLLAKKKNDLRLSLCFLILFKLSNVADSLSRLEEIQWPISFSALSSKKMSGL